MTKNIVTFIKEPLRQWVEKNSGAQQLPKFWLVPCDTSSPEYKSLSDEGARIFGATEWHEVEPVDDVVLRFLSVEGKPIFCLYAPDAQGEPDSTAVGACGLEEIELHFLQKTRFLIDSDIPALSTIPRQIVDGETFEADLENYFPRIHSFILQEGIDREPLMVSYVRALLSISDEGSPGCLFRENLIELALSIPEHDHEWLFYQILILARSKRYDNFYLELYKFLEFFFPIANISGLKSAISYTGSPLQLLEKCKEELKWTVNHNFGIRAASRYAGVAFAEILIERSLTFESEIPREMREKKSNSFKDKAMELLAELRHTLTHQNFKRMEVERPRLILATKSLFLFLTEAFGTYKRDVIGL